MTRDLFQPGDRLADYEIVRRLRAGGMATLFLGRRHGAAGVSRSVAIKVIHPHLAEDELIVRMFIDEARISSHISHSNVVYVEKFGEHAGVYYIAMEYVDGCSLEELLRTLGKHRVQLAPALAAHIAAEASAGLHAAHETADEHGVPLGIVHRDVSPSNILLTRDGRIKIIDFGIAKARGRLHETRTGAGLKGKLCYMAPEQAWGRAIDRRTDVYALGVVLWELLTGKPLVRRGDELEVLERVRHPEITPPGALNPQVTLALDEVVAGATAAEPADRPATALELRRELLAVVPAARAVPADAIAALVDRVRETLGPPGADADRKATRLAELAAPMTGGTTQLSPMPSSVGSAAGEVQPRSGRSARVPLILAGLALATAAVGIVVTVARSDGSQPSPGAASKLASPPGAAASTSPENAAADPASRPAPTTNGATSPNSDPNRPVGASTPAGVSTSPSVAADPPTGASTSPGAAADPPTEASTSADPPARASTPTKADRRPRPVAKRPARPTAKAPHKPADPSVRTVDVDGVVLADEPASQAPPAKSRPAQPSNAVKVDDTVLAK